MKMTTTIKHILMLMDFKQENLKLKREMASYSEKSSS